MRIIWAACNEPSLYDHGYIRFNIGTSQSAETKHVYLTKGARKAEAEGVLTDD